MELKCANCGHSLPNEDAKYCNNCGTLTPSHPFSPHSRARTNAPSSEEKSSPTLEQEDEPSRDDQRKSQPASSQRRSEASAMRKDEPPAWMDNLESSVAGSRSSVPQSRSTRSDSAPSRQKPDDLKAGQSEASSSDARPPASARPRPRSTTDFSWPEPVTHMVAKEPASTKDEAKAEPSWPSFEDFNPVPKPPSTAASEFRVKVWDQEDEFPEPSKPSSAHDEKSTQGGEVEHLPTLPLEVAEIRKEGARQSQEKDDIEHLPTQALEADEIRKESQQHESKERQRRQDFEMLETTPLVAQPSPQNKGSKAPAQADDFAKPSWNDENAFPVVERGNSPRPQSDTALKPERGNSARPSQPPVGATPFLGLDAETPRASLDQDRTMRSDPTATPFLGLDSNNQFPTEIAPETPQPVQDWQNYNAFSSNESVPFTPPPAQPVAPKSASQGKSGGRAGAISGVLVVLVLVVLIILGGGGYWFFAGHPFSQPVQAWQTYSNDSLKVSMELPSDWTGKNQPNQTVSLADSTQTGLIDLSISNDAPSDLAKYLTQQATKLSMDNITPSGSITFAGAQWTQLHGSIDVNNASYTDVLLATNHNGHLYLISFKAPQASYSDFDQHTFAHVRSTFKFL